MPYYKLTCPSCHNVMLWELDRVVDYAHSWMYVKCPTCQKDAPARRAILINDLLAAVLLAQGEQARQGTGGLDVAGTEL
jgi:hypothetical protein